MIGPRRVLVTGAGKRIGAGLSIALAEAGWHVIAYLNRVPLTRMDLEQWSDQQSQMKRSIQETEQLKDHES